MTVLVHARRPAVVDAGRGLRADVASGVAEHRAEALRLARRCLAPGADAALLVHRVTQSLDTGETELVYSALVDAFIGLPVSARGQRKALLKRARGVLSPELHTFLEQRVQAGLAPTEPIPDAPTAVLTKGFTGTAQLVHPNLAGDQIRRRELAAVDLGEPPPAPADGPAAPARIDPPAGPPRRRLATVAAVAAIALAAVVGAAVAGRGPQDVRSPGARPSSPESSVTHPIVPAPASSPVPEVAARGATTRGEAFLRSWVALLAEPASGRAASLFPPGTPQYQAVVDVLGELNTSGHAIRLREPGLRAEPKRVGSHRVERVTLSWSAVDLVGEGGALVRELAGPGQLTVDVEFESEDPDARAIATRVVGS
ncbi:hypothetical protein [Rhabdothermincola sediminis]|uniref:hypothetical protein n=1 Tax=Rhabdothermincola sediminis TaxID=2751370 RepID=UPI001AA03EA1|nr:hypothetical protein [Rhabdothermincola sediminis]